MVIVEMLKQALENVEPDNKVVVVLQGEAYEILSITRDALDPNVLSINCGWNDPMEP